MEMPGPISGLILRVARDGALRAAVARPGRLLVGRGRKIEFGGRVYSVGEPAADSRAQSLTHG
jgi:hypothetical protein